MKVQDFSITKKPFTKSTPLAERTVTVVGAGLAGSECALQLADMGFPVHLIEMRGSVMTPAHKTADCAELVCSNSFGNLSLESAPGQLKWEAELAGSKVLACAKSVQIPAGQALGVDRELFAKLVSQKIAEHPHIRRTTELVVSLKDIPRPCVIATGPLTHELLAQEMAEHFDQDFLYFFDAIAPIIATDSIDTTIAWKASRWGKGGADYFNCPLDKEQYFDLVNEIKSARTIESKEFEKCTPYFESCLPVEVMASRGDLTLAFGPMSPKGLFAPETDRRPFAVVQLRQDNQANTAYNMVGFQTKMAYGDQVRVFRKIPGLLNAEFLKLGSMHRNLYIHTPKMLNSDLSSRKDPWLFFAGQITGVEGYFESTCVGLMVAHFIKQKVMDMPMTPPLRHSAMGSLWHAITQENKEEFQPTNINFALLPPLENEQNAQVVKENGTLRDINKAERRQLQIQNAKTAFTEWLGYIRKFY